MESSNIYKGPTFHAALSCAFDDSSCIATALLYPLGIAVRPREVKSVTPLAPIRAAVEAELDGQTVTEDEIVAIVEDVALGETIDRMNALIASERLAHVCDVRNRECTSLQVTYGEIQDAIDCLASPDGEAKARNIYRGVLVGHPGALRFFYTLHAVHGAYMRGYDVLDWLANIPWLLNSRDV